VRGDLGVEGDAGYVDLFGLGHGVPLRMAWWGPQHRNHYWH
jgi:hypothetical protein